MILKMNNKNFLLGVLGIVFLGLGVWLAQAPKAEAADYQYLHIKLDTEGGNRDGTCGTLENCAQLWQFHGFNSLTHDGLEAASTPSGYQCPIWLVEEIYGMDDGGGVLWTKKSNKLSKNGTSVSSDLTDESYTACADTTVSSGWHCNTVDAGGVASFTYGLMDNRGGTEDITLSDAVATTYRPDVDILCAGANNWKTCESNSCASVVTANDWACNGTSKVWTPCTSPKTCNAATGACEAAATCDTNPTVTINPSTQNGLAGALLNYTIDIRNNDDATCPTASRTFNLTSTKPGDTWTDSFTATSLAVAKGGGTNSTTYKLTSPGGAAEGNYTFKVKAQDANGSAEPSGIYTVTTCSANTFIKFDTDKYKKNSMLKISFAIGSAEPTNDFARCVYNPSNTEKWSSPIAHTGGSGDMGSNISTAAGDVLGTWTTALKSGTTNCPAAPSGCIGSTKVVECLVGADCPSGTCNYVDNTCVAAATPNCNQLACGDAVSNQPCMCGLQLVSANGEYCCAGNNFYGASSTCITQPACAGGPSPPPGATCAAGDGCVAVGCTPPDPDCVAAGPAVLLNPLKCKDIICLIDLVVNFIFYIALPIVILMLVIAAFLFMTAGGEPQKLASARSIILYTLIGLLVIILAKGLAAALKYALGAK